MKLLEKDVSKQVKDFLKARGWRPVRTQFAFSPGSFATGEPGMPDWLFLRYEAPGRGLILWVEVKGPNDQRKCRCQPGDRKPCKVCRQRLWHERERGLGASVCVVEDIELFSAAYERSYGHLHCGEEAKGQLAIACDP